MTLTLPRFELDEDVAAIFLRAALAAENGTTTTAQDQLIATLADDFDAIAGCVPLNLMDDGVSSDIDQVLYVLHSAGSLTGPGRPAFLDDHDPNETYYQVQGDIEIAGTPVRIASTWEAWKHILRRQVDGDDVATILAVVNCALDDLNAALTRFEQAAAALAAQALPVA